MRKKIDEYDRLDRFYNTFTHNEKSKMMVLKMVERLQDVSEVSKLTEVPERTIYDWIDEWNKKKKPE